MPRARILGGAAIGLVASLAVAGPLLACTTALVARPVADYRAATIVVTGTVVRAEPDLVVRVEARYRGPAAARIVLRRPGPVTGWCPYPFGSPAVGAHVLVAVVDPADWQWPNSGVWTIGAGGSLGDQEAPWTGAPAPRTVKAALETMAIPPQTTMATEPAPAPPNGPLVVGLVAVAGLSVSLRRFRSAAPRRRRPA